jgi:tetratricopeptide (TPR) repeat protein
VAWLLNELANSYQNQGRYTEAEPLYQRSLTILEKSLGPDDPIATALNSLGSLYYAQGRYADAEPLLKRSLAIREKSLGARTTPSLRLRWWLSAALMNSKVAMTKPSRSTNVRSISQKKLLAQTIPLSAAH